MSRILWLDQIETPVDAVSSSTCAKKRRQRYNLTVDHHLEATRDI